MSIVVIGNAGQLSFELVRILGEDTICLGPEDTDITNESVLSETLSKLAPSVIINAAAYTAVDKAEEDFDLCHAINATAVENLAKYCKQSGAFLVHVSTDYVFNGHKGSPYLTDDTIEPQGVYGKTKADGEKALLELLPNASCLIRTAWVYSSHGNNFVKTMLRLMADKPQLSVIDDQIGTPTWAKGLAEVCVSAAQNKTQGVYHWTDEGVASWYDFALAIQELGIEKGLLSSAIPVLPIPSSQYPTPASRPHYSVLDKTSTRDTFSSLNLTHWRTQLSAMMDELKA
ncbi:dTDP-4-dehydrorhamnose reductase [Alteromonas sp. K632G]|jgi:dTDP-4-dehydrorhamnose reductase|uniref:dTDP-4-dehydrorhamnose reductase n=1 Tax=Alteromonas TaxID=226 RepID=UPI000C0DB060|nr:MULTISPECIES: dTDP-4-dehydrorhamnose reductase [Alteromonas]MBO7924272.1 dTDP-4-dehydrorhamnose reductase [Alteromonas sp. K632G]PHS60116.1 MAG: dTDP-4-dehydrorhamnose reductase [Alteromonas sp.]|tara:strand:+ start:355 stop:1215 length:861 start_codon:yes stop_codon:yes gene_type:complete